MFEKLKLKIQETIEKASKLHKEQEQQKLKQYNDEIANKTDWLPLKKGGANFKTHDLKKKNSSVLSYRLSLGGKLFIGIFALIGFVASIISAYLLLITFNPIGFFSLLFGVVFGGASLFMYKTMGMPIVFDREVGFIWKGHKQPKLSGDQSDKVYITYFSEVHALQIIPEYISSSKRSFYSYELNLVMKDASRLHLIDHGNYQQIASDAEEISQFLGKKVWDNTL